MNTILLGYSGEVNSLVKLAKETNGIYNYMPDAYLVGPIAVHSFMNIINKCCKMVKIVLEYDVSITQEQKNNITCHLSLFHYTFTDNILEIMLGPININSNMSIKIDNNIKYKKIRVEITDIENNIYNAPLDNELIIDVEEDNIRLDCINKIHQLCLGVDENPNYDVSNELDELKTRISVSNLSNKEYKKGLLVELGESRVGDGLLNPAYYKKWGQYYIRAWYQHHMVKKCPNYLDPAFQFYKDEKQKDDISELFEVYNEYEPPQISVNISNENITYRSLSTYPVQNVQYNRAVRQDLQANSGMNGNGGGCLHENCPVWINPKQKIIASKLKPNMTIIDSEGNETFIKIVTRKKCIDGTAPMTIICEDVCLTPYHPVCIPDKNNRKKWYFPIDVECAENIRCEYYYNFVLDNGGSILCGLDRIEVCTLGHGQQGPVLGHRFYGCGDENDPDGIVYQLNSLFPNHNGEIDLTNTIEIRDPNNGNRVMGLRRLD